MKLLLDKGADVEVKEEGGGTPLTKAINAGSEVMIKLLLEKGAKVNYVYRVSVSEPDLS